MLPNVSCSLCAEPAVRVVRGFEWCERHARNLEAVLRGDLALPHRSVRATLPLTPQFNGRTRRQVSAITRRQEDALEVLKRSATALKIRDVAEALGVPYVQARAALWQLRRRGKVKAVRPQRRCAGYRGVPQKLWRAA